MGAHQHVGPVERRRRHDQGDGVRGADLVAAGGPLARAPGLGVVVYDVRLDG